MKATAGVHLNDISRAMRTPTRFRTTFGAVTVGVMMLTACGPAEPGGPKAESRAAQSPSPIKRQHQKVRPTCGESFIMVATDSGRRRRIAGAPPSGRLTRAAGHWRDVWPSPDATMLLAQWSGECEIPTAFFITLDDGSMRVVTHHRDWTRAPESEALGWRRDGVALVRLERGLCGTGASRPGVYAIDPAGGSTFLRP